MKEIHTIMRMELSANHVTASFLKSMTIQQVVWKVCDYAPTHKVFYSNEYVISQSIYESMEALNDNSIKA
jgi:hypothetical protein